MFTRLNKSLILMLVVQLLLVGFVLTRGGEATLVEQPLLAGFDSASVTRLQLFGESSDKPKVELVKRGAAWVLASHFDHPADTTKVTDLLASIAKLAAAEPIATQATRHKQLRVGDKDFDRKLVITANGKDTIVHVGASAGLRRTAVRLGGDERVFGVAGVSSHAIGIIARDWVKGSYYETPSAEITKLVVQRGTQTIEFARAVTPPAGSGSAPPPPAEPWRVTFDGAPLVFAKGESLDTSAVNAIISDVATIAASPADPRRDASKPTVTVTVHHKDRTDVLDVITVDEEYWVKLRGLERATLVDKERLKTLVEVARDKLVLKEAAPAAPAPGAGSGAAAAFEP